MTRPRGEIRQALSLAAQALHEERGAFTWVQVAEKAQVGYSFARRHVDNMARAGDLVRVGHDKPAGSRVWMTLYEPADAAPAEGAAALADLDRVVRSWADFI